MGKDEFKDTGSDKFMDTGSDQWSKNKEDLEKMLDEVDDIAKKVEHLRKELNKLIQKK